MKLKHYVMLLLLAVVTMSLNCNKTDPPTSANVFLNIEPVITGQVYEWNTWAQSSDGQAVKFGKLDFYLTEVKLIKEDNSTVDIEDAFLYKLNPESTNGANGIGKIFILTDIPIGDYKGVKFGLGVSPEVASVNNGTYDVSKYTADDALSEYQGMTWGMLGYKHALVEGKTKNSSGTEQNFSYHIATDTFYTPFELSYPFDLKWPAKTIEMKLDIDKFLNPADASRNIKLSENSSTHSSKSSPKEMELAWKVMQNLREAITVK